MAMKPVSAFSRQRLSDVATRRLLAHLDENDERGVDSVLGSWRALVRADVFAVPPEISRKRYTNTKPRPLRTVSHKDQVPRALSIRYLPEGISVPLGLSA